VIRFRDGRVIADSRQEAADARAALAADDRVPQAEVAA
jgi:putative ABC transport system ATP-binding protein